jgi:hypothetical protein
MAVGMEGSRLRVQARLSFFGGHVCELLLECTADRYDGASTVLVDPRLDLCKPRVALLDVVVLAADILGVRSHREIHQKTGSSPEVQEPGVRLWGSSPEVQEPGVRLWGSSPEVQEPGVRLWGSSPEVQEPDVRLWGEQQHLVEDLDLCRSPVALHRFGIQGLGFRV